VKHVKGWTATSAAALIATAVFALSTRAIADSNISPSDVQQGIAISPIPFDKLNLQNRPRALVALGSYLVNGVGDCVGCHTFPRFLRPVGTGPTAANSTGNLAGQGSDPRYGNPFLDPVPPPTGPDQSLTGQMKANINADTHGIVTHTQKGVPIYPNNHFLAGGRCFGFFMSRNLTPDDDSGMPRGLTEAEFIQVMRTGKDLSCTKMNPGRTAGPRYGGAKDGDPVCSTPEGGGAGTSFNPEVMQTMPWPTYHSMTDTELKAIYAYLSSLPQAKACNTVQNGCSGWFGDAKAAGQVGANRYRYANTDDCPNNYNPVGPARTGDDSLPFGVAPPQ
jgi:hypothetical protein